MKENSYSFKLNFYMLSYIVPIMKMKQKIEVSKRESLESKLRLIAHIVGSYVIVKVGVDDKGKIGILEIKNDFDDQEDEYDDDEIVYPIIDKPNLRKPLTYLDCTNYIG